MTITGHPVVHNEMGQRSRRFSQLAETSANRAKLIFPYNSFYRARLANGANTYSLLNFFSEKNRQPVNRYLSFHSQPKLLTVVS